MDVSSSLRVRRVNSLMENTLYLVCMVYVICRLYSHMNKCEQMSMYNSLTWAKNCTDLNLLFL